MGIVFTPIKDGIDNRCMGKVRALKLCAASEVTAPDVRLNQTGSREICKFEIGSLEIRSRQIRVANDRPGGYRPVQIRPAQIGTGKIRTHAGNAFHYGALKRGIAQTCIFQAEEIHDTAPEARAGEVTALKLQNLVMYVRKISIHKTDISENTIRRNKLPGGTFTSIRRHVSSFR